MISVNDQFIIERVHTNSETVDTAQVLSLFYGRFVEIWRQKGSGTPKDKMSQICTSTRERTLHHL